MAKAIKKQALGRGLSALLQDSKEEKRSEGVENNASKAGSIIELELELIEVNPFQPRTQFKEDAIRELASSIQELGVIQPITVRKTKTNTFQLVSGERRFRASKVLGNKTIPAYIRVANDQEALEMALVENIQRQDLDPIEIALSYQRLIDDIQLTQEQMSQRVGKKRSTIANYLRLLKLDPLIQTGMRDGFISMGHGRAIVNINSHADQISIYKEIIAHKLSVRATETLVKNYSTPKQVKAVKKNDLPEFVKDGVQKIASYFGHKIDVKMEKKGSGKILIPFHSKEDYDRILKLIERDK
ncbi:MAG: ParB/RepB/Spo0J family partition protein [Flavobacteriaceae bacterium]|jgi:ParB family chromosome partitioning protein|nr:ParB/RepB/Spo0J family partition protein [Flavobacteriaceae bacterium]